MILNKYSLHLTLRQRLHLKKMNVLKNSSKGTSVSITCNIFKLLKYLMFHTKAFFVMINYRISSPFFRGINSHSALRYLYNVKIWNSNAWQTHTSSASRLATPSAYSVDVISKCGILKCIKCGSLAVAVAIIFTLVVCALYTAVYQSHNQFPMQQQQQWQPLQFSILSFRVIDEIILNANFGQISFIDTNIY